MLNSLDVFPSIKYETGHRITVHNKSVISRLTLKTLYSWWNIIKPISSNTRQSLYFCRIRGTEILRSAGRLMTSGRQKLIRTVKCTTNRKTETVFLHRRVSGFLIKWQLIRSGCFMRIKARTPSTLTAQNIRNKIHNTPNYLLQIQRADSTEVNAHLASIQHKKCSDTKLPTLTWRI